VSLRIQNKIQKIIQKRNSSFGSIFGVSLLARLGVPEDDGTIGGARRECGPIREAADGVHIPLMAM